MTTTETEGLLAEARAYVTEWGAPGSRATQFITRLADALAAHTVQSDAQPEQGASEDRAEQAVGRWTYARLSKLMDAEPGTREGAELAYLAGAIAQIEEYGPEHCADHPLPHPDYPDPFASQPEQVARGDRQRQVSEWCERCFGVEHATSLPARGIRMLEEAIELAQAVGVDPAMAHKLIDFVYGRPVGEIGQEIGGVSLCILALANAAGLDADAEEAKEITRVLSKDPAVFTKRNAEKNAAGFDTTGGYVPAKMGAQS